jgi:HAD superfamily hydrolase (TIGR01509 family)
MPSTILFDIDGTLVDSNDAHARAWVHTFAEHGMAVPFDKVRRAIGMGGDKLMPLVAGISEDSEEGGHISERRGEIFRETYLPRIQPFPQVRKLLERFRSDDMALAVASSAKEDELKGLLEAAGVADLLTVQTSSDDADRSKPDPDIVEAAVKRARCDRDHTIMLGDTPYDVEAASRAGIPLVGLECGGWGRRDLEGAVEVYASPADLLSRYDTSAFARLRSSLQRTS